MRVGLYLDGTARAPLQHLLARAKRKERAGFDTLWVSQTYHHDALTLLGLLGRATSRVELGTWVVPVFLRHPVALVQAAATTQAASRGRLALALGVGHRAVIEKRMGIAFRHPVGRMRWTLEVMEALVPAEGTGPPVAPLGSPLSLRVPGARRPPVLVAALQPRMLSLAGSMSDGAALWLGAARYLREQALPRLRRAAEEGGRRPPRVVCGLPVAITDDVVRGREAVARVVGPSARLPSYRAVLDAGGAARAEDVALVGDEAQLAARLDELAELGVSDFHAVVVPVPGEAGSAARAEQALLAWRRRAG